ncbi:hypothetical protein [Gracilimonas sediminicola]|uniref:hypothetical protein n=1 Tax=Gracilimonas sediminicola TaxID=2952158 RepID=UPI0038D40862
MSRQDYKKGDLLQKGECMQLFMDELRIGQTTYYHNFRDSIKFKSYGKKIGENGEIKETMFRIPYEVAIGLINRVKDDPQPDDPSMEELKEFVHYMPA